MASKIRDALADGKVNKMGKLVAKILEGKADDNTVEELIREVMRYSAYESVPDLNAKLPTLTFSKETGSNRLDFTTGGYYNNKTDVLWINKDFFSAENLLANEWRITALLETVCHEMRHWYQFNEKYNKAQENTKGLLMSGVDNGLFAAAVDNLQQRPTFSESEIEELYTYVNNDEI